MVPVTSLVGACVLLAALSAGAAGCGKAPGAAKTAGDARALEAGYLAPPGVRRVQVTDRGIGLSGVGPPGGRVRLASPAGEALFADVDDKGRWTLGLGAIGEPRI